MPATIPVHDGVAETVAIGPHGDAAFTLGRGEETKVTVQFEPSARYVEAPVQPGTQVGNLTVLLAGKPQQVPDLFGQIESSPGFNQPEGFFSFC